MQDICRLSPLPVIADIQFSAESALNAIKAGVSGIRVNPGIINDHGMLEKIAAAARVNNTVIRVGANAGSLKPHEISRRIAGGMDKNSAVADALCSAVLEQCAILEKYGVKIGSLLLCVALLCTGCGQAGSKDTETTGTTTTPQTVYNPLPISCCKC